MSPCWLKFAGEMSEGRSLTRVNIGLVVIMGLISPSATLEDLPGNETYSPVAYQHRLEGALG